MTDETKTIRLRFPWVGEMDRLKDLLAPLTKELEAQEVSKPDVDVQVNVQITADYASIQSVRDILEPWIELWGGDEWGESMFALHSAGHTSYGLDDEDCARVTRILWKNVESQKDWMDGEGRAYGLSSPSGEAQAAAEAVERRDYWLKGGNLGKHGKSAEIAKATIDTLPPWLFGDS